MSVADQSAAPRCYSHPDRTAGSVCRRCGRPICPECMREAPVGWQCASCVRQDSRAAPVTRWRPSRTPGSGRIGRTRVTPVVVALIAINVAAYVYEQQHLTLAFELKYFLVPAELHTNWYAAITSAFLHLNATHILLNMITLAIVGPPLEAEVGRVRFGVLYLLSAIGGSVGFYLLAPLGLRGAGASGAIFGLMGAYFVLSRLRGWESQSIAGLLLVNIIYSFTGNVAWQAHLGGLVVGSLTCLGLMWSPGGRRPSQLAQVVQGLAVVIAGAVAMGLLVQIPPGHVNL